LPKIKKPRVISKMKKTFKNLGIILLSSSILLLVVLSQTLGAHIAFPVFMLCLLLGAWSYYKYLNYR